MRTALQVKAAEDRRNTRRRVKFQESSAVRSMDSVQASKLGNSKSKSAKPRTGVQSPQPLLEGSVYRVVGGSGPPLRRSARICERLEKAAKAEKDDGRR